MVAAEMAPDEIDDFLESRGSGTLSLAKEGEAYAIPESFGYDGEFIYFQLAAREGSRKMSFIETTDVATFTVWAEEPARSIVARGTIEPVPETDVTVAANAIAENASLPTLNVLPDSTLDDQTMVYYRLIPRSLSGRAFGTDPETIAD
ncbi:MAG: pyridoxamine 5'-phosphate oxidase family protein [Halolamina sp.]